MSTHIAAKKGEIAEAVLLPGDPLRAKFIAETFLQNAHCYTEVRGMFGFTGDYKGKRVSVQGTGMGIPSISIYANELFNDYGVKKAIRVGTAGAIQEDVKLRSVVLAIAASTDSNVNAQRFGARASFAPNASFALLSKAYEVAKSKKTDVRAGNIFSTDLFYADDAVWKEMKKFGVLAVEMETAELYTLAAKYGREALAILTISDSIVKGESTSAEERQVSFTQMMEVALETITAEDA